MLIRLTSEVSIIIIAHIVLRRVSLVYSKFIPTTTTFERIVVLASYMLLKIRLFPCSTTGCAYSMEWLAVAHLGFHRKSHNARSSLGKLIASFIGLPILQASDFLFTVRRRV